MRARVIFPRLLGWPSYLVLVHVHNVKSRLGVRVRVGVMIMIMQLEIPAAGPSVQMCPRGPPVKLW